MADKKITQLTNITGANLVDADEFVVVDISADETKSITLSELKTAFDSGSGFVRITGDTMTGALDVQSTITADGLTSSAVITAEEGRSNTAGTGQIVIDPDDTTVSAAFRIDQTDNKLNIDMNGGGTWKKGFSLYSNNDISFYNDSGNAKLFWDASAESLGIGTDSPDASSGYTPLALNGTASGWVQLKSGDTTVADWYSSGGVESTFRSLSGGLNFSISGSDAFKFVSNSTERMRIDASGNVGIGHVPSGNLTSGYVLRLDGGAQTYLAFNNDTHTTQVTGGFVIGSDSSAARITQRENQPLIFDTNNSEAMRIDSSGNLLVGATASESGISKAFVEYSSHAGFYGLELHDNSIGTTATQIAFYKQAALKGSITTTSSATAYNTSSDYRLKTDAQPMTGASARVQALNPVNFEWIADGSRVDGFLAHEAQAVVPECVTGTKDAMKDEEYQVSAATGDIYTAGAEAGFNEVSAAIEASPAYYDVDGNIIKAEVIAQAAVHEAYDAVEEVIHSTNVEQPEALEDGQQWRETTPAVMGTRSVPDMQGIDQSKMVPLLVASLQEALARITALENA